MDKKVISYNEYSYHVKKLALAIDTHFDAIYGLPRGGLPIAVSLSHLLDKPVVMSIEQFKLEFPKDRTLLIVDDIVDTGETLKALTKNIDIRYLTASLYYKPLRSSFKPDYYLIETDAWEVFPWETEVSKASEYHQEKYPEVFNAL